MNLFVLPQVSMTETLFGGLLLAALLFFVSRRLGLPNFWAGILSGALPFLLYLAYSQQHWTGGDVLAIHFAVYLANAGLLMVFGGMQQKKQKLHWAPRLIIGFFIGLVVLNAVLLSISSRGLPDSISNLFLPHPANETVHTAFPGLIPHDRNKLYEPHLARLEQQRHLGWKIGIEGWDTMRSKTPSTITLKLDDAQGAGIAGAEVTMGLWRMANSRDDQKFSLSEVSPGVYQTTMTLNDSGRWILDLYIQHGEDTYIKQQTLYIDGD
ncbi:FixH family protein [Methylovorus sp. MP688]|uniref:FixH family protein n=1 Tax=Methylovorus sp. (strain MP688) TaxID=887061 RepID=UPI0001EC4DF1|nr:FixH family protein [Methylovorus sp. MP688]ADQ85239.1 FixH family protein [Methylovorus sp. MP688]